MADEAEIHYQGKSWKFPVYTGTENERAIDISTLRSKSGLITLDNGYQNTGATTSAITYIDGEKGILRYRGYPIEDLAEHATFPETAYLLIYGELPTAEQLARFRRALTENALIHEDMLHFFVGMPSTAHPMGILSSMVNALALYYPNFYVEDMDSSSFDLMAARLISKVRTIAAFSYKKSIGEPFVYPDAQKPYCANFLNMMFHSHAKPYVEDDLFIAALNALLIVHADHEQNCSTSTVRLVGSSKANLYASVCAGVCALWGPLHGGANQKAIETLMEIHASGMPVHRIMERAKDKNDPFKLSGFGHRIYKSYDPRAKVLKNLVERVFATRNIQDPLLDIAYELEQRALKDDYFLERKLYPNVDFYSGILYRAMGIPVNMFTVMFAIGRLPGWIAHWKEMHDDEANFKIGRPRQIYIGPTLRKFIPLKERCCIAVGK
ncbi:MAG TPA: citrate synthase [Fibrobacteraceae bacterium]|nr:citrate synthase [Fibrobacteraceae bacterium]